MLQRLPEGVRPGARLGGCRCTVRGERGREPQVGLAGIESGRARRVRGVDRDVDAEGALDRDSANHVLAAPATCA